MDGAIILIFRVRKSRCHGLVKRNADVIHSMVDERQSSGEGFSSYAERRKWVQLETFHVEWTVENLVSADPAVSPQPESVGDLEEGGSPLLGPFIDLVQIQSPCWQRFLEIPRRSRDFKGPLEGVRTKVAPMIVRRIQRSEVAHGQHHRIAKDLFFAVTHVFFEFAGVVGKIHAMSLKVEVSPFLNDGAGDEASEG